ncbi:hypothetical protein NXW09_29350 [Bacteroides ovatus]|nr:hypothetical protein [Bacteroides ovatus]
MRHNNIVSAIEWLPGTLFTEEIVEAAVESKEIEVLSHIPGRFPHTRRHRTNHRGQQHGGGTACVARNIPEAYRSGAVCDYAMRKTEEYHGRSRSNGYPRNGRSGHRNGRGDFDILAFIPERLWDAQLAYLALRSYILTRITRTAGQTPS